MTNTQPGGQNGGQPQGNLIVLITVTVVLALAIGLLADPDGARLDEVSYSRFVESLEAGRFERVVIDGAELTGVTAGTEGEPRRLRTYAPGIADQALLSRIAESGSEIVTRPPATGGGWLAWLPLLLFLGVWIYLLRRMGGVGGRLPGGQDEFLRARGRKKEASRPEVRFDDVAGQEQAKREVMELVEFLRDPGRFSRVGATVPTGVILMGPPGTGKTLLARALAGEAGVPFFSSSASEFIELFVGVGAARVRRMFETAKAEAPAVIFIDELDSVGRARGTGLGGGHDEREQTLNQILAELDGFTGREGVVVIAATNRPDVLDPALLRPGRFDRHVTLSLPDREARAAILAVHLRGIPVARDVDIDTLAAGTPGFSGADLRNLVNEAAITAAREERSDVPMACFDAARDKVVLGTVRTLAIHPEERHRLAVHEAGHTVVAWRLPEADTLYKVTIIPRGQSLGGTHLLPDVERHTLPEGYLHAQLAVMLAGRAAETVFLGSVSSGADDDIRRATRLARQMIARWGMSESIGPMDMRESEEHPFLGREVALSRHAAEATAAEVDAAVRALLIGAERVARETIEADRDAATRLIARLEAEETLDAAAVQACLGAPASATGGPGAAPAPVEPPEQRVTLAEAPRERWPGAAPGRVPPFRDAGR